MTFEKHLFSNHLVFDNDVSIKVCSSKYYMFVCCSKKMKNNTKETVNSTQIPEASGGAAQGLKLWINGEKSPYLFTCSFLILSVLIPLMAPW